MATVGAALLGGSAEDPTWPSMATIGATFDPSQLKHPVVGASGS
jgi:hypothetical protein